MAEREPSVSSLADDLSRTSAAPARPRVAIARPSQIMRVFIAAVLLLTLVVLAALLALGLRISGLVADMRQAQVDLDHRERLAVPSEAVLADADATRREVQARPLAAGVVWQARCELLARQGDWAALDTTCVQVGLDAPDDLTPAARLLHAEALMHLGRTADAGRTLHGIDQSRLDAAGREYAAALAGRLWLVERPAEQRGQAATEGADQLDAR